MLHALRSLVAAVWALPAILFLAARIEAQPSVPQSVANLTFGVYQSDKATQMYRSFIPVLDAIQGEVQKRLGRPIDIQLQIFKTYDEAIEALVSGRVDFVRFGPASYITACQRNPRIRLLAMEHEDGKKRFQGVVIVPADSAVQCLADLKGRTFAFGDPNSTIGRYLVQAELAKAGVKAADLKKYEYLDRHDKVAKAVELGDFDAGAVKIETYEKRRESGKLRVIASFDNVTKPWASREGLESGIQDALREALLALKDPAALKELGVSGFLPAADEEYAFVRDGMKHAEIFGR